MPSPDSTPARSAARTGGDASPGSGPAVDFDGFAARFADNLQMHGATLAWDAAERRSFVSSFRAAWRALTPEEAARVAARVEVPEVRHAWLADRGELAHTQVVQAHAHVSGGLARFYLYTATPEHRFAVVSGGVLADTKVRSVEFFGEHWVYEHNVIVKTAAPGEVRFSDERGRIEAEDRVTVIAPGAAPPQPGASGIRKLKRLLAKDWWQNRKHQFAGILSRRIGRLRRFERAWAVADRRHQAGDNAEALFRHLHAHRPDINAWFAVGRRVPAYRELRRLGAKVVPYGSIRHYLLLAQAEVFASSQSDPGSRNPFGAFQQQSWLFVYLKHGILHTDHHRRFNPMQIDLVPAATEGERLGLSGEGNRYRFAPSEVPLTGMPRLDPLQRCLDRRTSAGEQPDVLLIAPTWRIYLASPNADHRWRVNPGVEHSEYVRHWTELLNDDRLRRLCESRGLRPVLLMHPRFQHHPGLLPTPEWITVTDYQHEVSSLFASTRLAITDYSSIAFEVAYAGAPTVYFQFDRDTFFSGRHSGQQGDYDYAAQGFGPVVEAARDAVDAADALLDPPSFARSEYAARIGGLYTWRDDRNSERTVAAIERLLRDAR